MKIDKSELCRYENNIIYDDGYRIVYYYKDGSYKL